MQEKLIKVNKICAFFYCCLVSIITPVNSYADIQKETKVIIQDLIHIYDGSPKEVLVTTRPANKDVTVTYNGITESPVDPGNYEVYAKVIQNGFEGSNEAIMQIQKQAAVITITDLIHTYDGTPKKVTVSTEPPGLKVAVTYNGKAEPPINAGTYTVEATILDTEYSGTATETMIINDKPTYIGIDDITVNEDAPSDTIDLNKAFDDEQELTFSVENNSNQLLFTSVSIAEDTLLILDYAPDQNGDGSISILATDTYDASTKGSFNVTVNPVNDPPSFTAEDPAPVPEDGGAQSIVNWAAFSPGPDNEAGQSVAGYNVINLSNPDLFSTAPSVSIDGTLSFTPAPDQYGTATFDVFVQDDGGTVNGGDDTSPTQQFTITIDPVNDPPSFTAEDPPAVDEDAGPQTILDWASFNSGADNEDQTAAYTVTNISNSSLFSALPSVNSNGDLSYTPANNAFGSSTFDVYVTDSGNGNNTSETKTFTITINEVNDPPSFSAENPPVVSEDAGQQIIKGWATFDPGPDEESQVASYIVSNVTNPSLFTENPSVNSNGDLSYTLAPDQYGSSSFTVTVTDDSETNNTSSPQEFTITVEAVNDRPSFSTKSIPEVNEDAGPRVITGWASFDPGAANESEQIPTYVISEISNPDLFSSVPEVNSQGDLSFTGAPDQSGSSNFEVYVKDDGGTLNGGKNTSVPKTFTITINPINDPPEFTSDPVTDATEDNIYTYNITFSDNETASADLSLVPATLPEWLSLSVNNGSAVLSGTPLNKHVGDNAVKLTLSDGAASTEQSFTINVQNVNDPPTFTSTPLTKAIKDDLYTYNIATSDPDAGDELTLTVRDKPDWLTFSNTGNGTGKLSGTPGDEHLNLDNSVHLEVKDKAGSSETQSFSITVVIVNSAPKFTSEPVTTAKDGVLYQYQITVSDADPNDNLTISATKKPGWLTLTDNGNGTALLEGTPGNDHIGNHDIALKVVDAVGESDTQLFTINVENTNEDPYFVSKPIKQIQEDEEYNYEIITNDPDLNDSRELTAVSELPGWLTLTENNGNGVLKGTPSDENVGDITITLKVTDQAGASANQEFTLTVINKNDIPYFTSEAPVSAEINQPYLYEIQTADDDENDQLTIEALELPSWLSLTDNGNRTADLSGTPTDPTISEYQVILVVKDDNGAQSLQEFNIQVNTPPSVTSFTKEVNEDEHLPLTFNDFNNHFSDINNDPIQSIKIEELPLNGTLKINDQILNAGSEISTEDLSGLVYIPDLDYQGTDKIGWKASDGLSYSGNAEITITINPLNDPPRLEVENELISYTPGKSTQIPIAENLVLTDPDNDEIAGAQIFFNVRTYQSSEDRLTFEETGDIKGSYNKEAGTLIFSGLDSKENYQEVLRSVQYENVDKDDPSFENRILNIYVDDGDAVSEFLKIEIQMIDGLVELKIPSGITPNDDGINDQWMIDNLELYPECEVKIFTKSGSLIFNSKGYNQLWDGTYNNEPLPVGTYYYIIDLNEFEKSYRGTITVIR